MLGKHTLEPNEKTELKVTYRTAGMPGFFEKRVILSTNIPGQENVEIFMIKGEVQEAPGAKISVKPRRVILEGAERAAGKKQAFSFTNEGSLPLVINRIHSKDGNVIYYDGSKEGNIVIEPAQTKTIELQLQGHNEEKPGQEYILIDSNAKNAGQSGYFLLVQYGAKQ
jgi:hypothetical protein